jgi:phage shock protein A
MMSILMSRFDRYERKIDDLEGEVEAYDLGQKTLSDEIGELENDERIDEALARLKAKMAEPGAQAESESE